VLGRQELLAIVGHGCGYDCLGVTAATGVAYGYAMISGPGQLVRGEVGDEAVHERTGQVLDLADRSAEGVVSEDCEDLVVLKYTSLCPPGLPAAESGRRKSEPCRALLTGQGRSDTNRLGDPRSSNCLLGCCSGGLLTPCHRYSEGRSE
jgi:hypothetical protein